MTRNVLAWITCLSLFAAMPAFAGPEDDTGSVYDYNINWAVQSGVDEITVELQARYCPACNPNTGNSPGCTAFEFALPPYGHRGCSRGYPDGRFTAVRVKNNIGVVLATQKMICTPANWPLNVVHKEQFIFSGLPLVAGDTIIVEADCYCSWCGHWYPNPVPLTVQASDSEITYTGDTSGLVGTSAAVCAVLLDATTALPLTGRPVTFTLNGLPPVSPTTDALGIACTLLPIPTDMTAGTYPMTARFAGDAEYWPSSNRVDFQVIVKIPVAIDIKPGSCPNAINKNGKGVIPVAILGGADFDVTQIDPVTLTFEGMGLGVKGNGAFQCSVQDVSGDFTTPEGAPDGHPDLVCQFVDDATTWPEGMEMAIVTGTLKAEFGAIPIEGSDSVKLAP